MYIFVTKTYKITLGYTAKHFCYSGDVPTFPSTQMHQISSIFNTLLSRLTLMFLSSTGCFATSYNRQWIKTYKPCQDSTKITTECNHNYKIINGTEHPAFNYLNTLLTNEAYVSWGSKPLLQNLDISNQVDMYFMCEVWCKIRPSVDKLLERY